MLPMVSLSQSSMDEAVFPKIAVPMNMFSGRGHRGEIGAFLTNERLLAVSITSGQWNTRNLKIAEKQSVPEMLIAAHIMVMLTNARVVTFGSHTNGFFQTPLAPWGSPRCAKAAEGRWLQSLPPHAPLGSLRIAAASPSSVFDVRKPWSH